MAVTTQSDPSGPESAERPAPKRRARRWLVLLIALALLLAAAPALVTKTPLKGVVLAMVGRASPRATEISAASISAGWLSPISVTDLELRQDGDKLQVSVPALSIDRTLLELLFDRTNLGRIRLERPMIEAQLQRDQAKLEQELEAAPAALHKAAAMSVDLEVADGTVTLHDARQGREIKLEQVTVDLRLLGSPGADALAGATGRIRFASPGGDFAGFVTGPAQVDAELADGALKVSPLTVDVSGGRLAISPRLQLKDPWLLEVDPGRLVDHVRVSPEMCNGWLKFALPVLAEATEVAGEFSVDLQQCSVPLAAPKTGATAGTIDIHAIELGPGPLVEQFMPLIDKLREFVDPKKREPPGRLNIARDSRVEFRLADGRVYHQGLRLELRQMTIETSGSVGFDESLAMTAEIHLPDRWMGSGPLAEALKSQPLKLAVGGTLKKPKVDLPELRNLNRETLRNTARDLLRSGVRRELDRLLKPREE